MPTLNWIGKDKVINHHNDVPFRVLEKQYTFGDVPDSGNMIIHGDNLEALKALLPKYEGKVKCIYIDPPYNTGEEKWIYNDNVNDPRIRKWLGQVVGKEADDLTRHDKWLCMMYPRLTLLQKLLSDDGAIFISLDEKELANLRHICDEIFGRTNYITTFIWHKKIRPSNKLVDKDNGFAHGISTNIEYVVAYAKNIANIKFNTDNLSEKNLKAYRNPDNDPRGPWITVPLWADSNSNKEQTLVLPDGSELTKKWFINQETLDELFAENKVHMGKTGFRKKVYLSEVVGQAPMNFLDASRFGTSDDGTSDYKNIMGVANFTNPKPVLLIEYIINLIWENKDCIILDSFAGSGTTAQAVLNLNRKDSGKRKFILVELGDYADTLTAERIRRVMNGYGEGKNAVEGTGGSFDFYELGTTIFDNQTELLNDEADTEQIRQYVWYAETHTAYKVDPNRSNPYLLGTHNFTDYYFYYEPKQETVLDWKFLQTLKQRAEQYIIYADRCLLAQEEMQLLNIVFKKIPRDIKRL